MTKPELVFVSPRFLFPADTGGAIRTTEILRNMRGGRFRISLLSPARDDQVQRYASELTEIADAFEAWPARDRARWQRLPLLASSLPLAVASDRSREGLHVVATALARRPAVAVFDFLHSAVLTPARMGVPSVLFAHNVEAEIVERHLQHAAGWKRAMWRSQLQKMRRFEGESLRRFDRVVAVSERDAKRFRSDFGVQQVDVIPTGVDFDYFNYVPSESNNRVVFTGSMDWLPNVDAVRWFRNEVWPRIKQRQPAATMTVVGRNPPLDLMRGSRDWIVTGRVDDVRPYVQRAAAYVIPIRIAGGTRIKAFEAMAMGVPVVSTAIGIEGLDVTPTAHYMQADQAEQFAQAVVSLLQQPDLGRSIAERARQHVQQHYSNATVARAFENICTQAMQ